MTGLHDEAPAGGVAPEANRNGPGNCSVCGIIRVYLMIGAPLLLMMLLRPDVSFISGIHLTSIFATLVGIGCAALIAWKAYVEYWRK